MRKNYYFLIFFCLVALSMQGQHTSARIDHISLAVKNLDKSIAFYDALFSFDTTANPFPGSRVRWYLIGSGVQFHLIEMPSKVMSNDLFQHLCISVDSLETFIISLKIQKVPYFNSQHEPNGINTRLDGVKQLFIQDPDGYWIEVNNHALHL